ncbi:hypothetical protein A0J61_04023 [Choanephora cucurbitarum]|nr:hypothetical protein A0J61_04023 [Choanephora cucurbitarum]
MPIIQLRPEDAEHIRSYARALGLTPQEEKALNDNQALISHTLALQQQSKLDPGTLRQKAQQKQMHSHREEKRKLRHLPGRKGTSSEECIIS